MNLSLMSLELAVVGLGIVMLLADLWLPAERKRALGYAAAAALTLLFINTLPAIACSTTGEAFWRDVRARRTGCVFKRFSCWRRFWCWCWPWSLRIGSRRVSRSIIR